MDPTTESLITALARRLSFDEDMEPFKPKATLGDLDSLPENERGQIIDGDLWLLPRSAAEHALAIREISYHLTPCAREPAPDGWIVLGDVEILFGPHLLVPDIAGWRKSRLPEIPERTRTFELRPDWICEVLSPSTARFDKGRKREIYGESGVPFVWHIDPFMRTVDVFELDGPTYRVTGFAEANDKVALAPFHDVEFDFARLWAR
jgi:Uma2 family endonuclease